VTQANWRAYGLEKLSKRPRPRRKRRPIAVAGTTPSPVSSTRPAFAGLQQRSKGRQKRSAWRIASPRTSSSK